MTEKLLDPAGFVPDLEASTRRQVQRFAKALFADTRLRLEVRSGRRSCAEQARLYAQGRTTGGAIVTHAEGCRSWHTLGRAVDAYVITPEGRRSTNQSDYEKAGRLWEAEFGGVWGGDFAGFGAGGDAGHFEYHPGLRTETVCPNPKQCEQAVSKWGQPTQIVPMLGIAAFGAVLGVSAAYYLWRKA